MSTSVAKIVGAAGAAAGGGSIVTYLSAGGFTAIAAVPATAIGVTALGVIAVCGLGYCVYSFIGGKEEKNTPTIIDGSAQDVDKQ
jgi:hypothetical protein